MSHKSFYRDQLIELFLVYLTILIACLNFVWLLNSV